MGSLIVSRGFGDQGGGSGSPVVSRGFGDIGTPTVLPPLQLIGITPYQRGTRWANVPGGKAENITLEDGAGHLKHSNSVQPVVMSTSDKLSSSGTYSGAVKFRFRNSRTFPVPNSVRNDDRFLDEFGNPIFPFTGR